LEIPLAKKTSTTSGTARNVGSTINRKDLNMRRECSNNSDSSHGRDSRDETTVVRTHQQQHKRQLEQQGMQTTAGMPKPVETSEEEGMYCSRDAEAGPLERLTAERTT
jgi:hypothetical protein